MFLCSAVSSPLNRSKCFTLYLLHGRPVHSGTNSTSQGSIRPCCMHTARRLFIHISTKHQNAHSREHILTAAYIYITHGTTHLSNFPTVITYTTAAIFHKWICPYQTLFDICLTHSKNCQTICPRPDNCLHVFLMSQFVGPKLHVEHFILRLYLSQTSLSLTDAVSYLSIYHYVAMF